MSRKATMIRRLLWTYEDAHQVFHRAGREPQAWNLDPLASVPVAGIKYDLTTLIQERTACTIVESNL